jgi:hypothetical protein
VSAVEAAAVVLSAVPGVASEEVATAWLEGAAEDAAPALGAAPLPVVVALGAATGLAATEPLGPELVDAEGVGLFGEDGMVDVVLGEGLVLDVGAVAFVGFPRCAMLTAGKSAIETAVSAQRRRSKVGRLVLARGTTISSPWRELEREDRSCPFDSPESRRPYRSRRRCE